MAGEKYDAKALYDRITQKLEQLKLSPRAASLMSGKGADVIRNLQRAVRSDMDFEFRTGTLEALSAVLQTSPHWLLTGEGPDIAKFSEKMNAVDDGSMPIFATKDLDGDRFQISDYVIRRIRRPEILETVEDAFGFVVENDAMAPAYEQGDAVLIHPRRGGAVWRDFLVRFWNEEQTAKIRRLNGTRDGFRMLQRFNPPQEEMVSEKTGFSVIVGKLHNFG